MLVPGVTERDDCFQPPVCGEIGWIGRAVSSGAERPIRTTHTSLSEHNRCTLTADQILVSRATRRHRRRVRQRELRLKQKVLNDKVIGRFETTNH
jgi:hypothetical protein